MRENPTGRAQVYNVLAGKLSALTQGKESLLLTQTQQALQQLNASLQQAQNHLISAGTASYTVWATSFTQRSLPNGLKPKTSPYVALPDAFLKFANWGTLSNIPSIYIAVLRAKWHKNDMVSHYFLNKWYKKHIKCACN